MSNCLVLHLETTRVLFPKSCRCAMLHWTLLFVQIPTVDSACLIHLKSHWPETLLTARLQENDTTRLLPKISRLRRNILVFSSKLPSNWQRNMLPVIISKNRSLSVHSVKHFY